MVVKEIADFKHAVTMSDGTTRMMTLWEAGAWKQAIAAARGDIKGLALLTDLYDRFGIALPETPTLAEPLTQDEKPALRQLFADWAAENPEGAYALLADIRKQQQTPSSSSEESEQEVGRAAS